MKVMSDFGKIYSNIVEIPNELIQIMDYMLIHDIKSKCAFDCIKMALDDGYYKYRTIFDELLDTTKEPTIEVIRDKYLFETYTLLKEQGISRYIFKIKTIRI